MTPEGERLDRHLKATIEELSGRTTEEDLKMRGIQRLANAAGNLMKQADAEADAAASELEAAYTEQAEVAKRYSRFAKEVSAAAKEARDNLNQLTNIPLGDLPPSAEAPDEPGDAAPAAAQGEG